MILDRIFDEKIGFGPAQYVTFGFLSLVDLNDGAQLILSSFLTPIIQHQWNLSQDQASNLASIFYLGSFIGSICSGKFADQYGRRPLIIIGSLMQILVCSFFFWIDTYSAMIYVRGLYGFSFGFTIALTTTVFAEITPSKYRGKGIIFLNFCVSFGKLYGLALAYIFLDSFVAGNWRAMMILSCVPNLIVFIGSILKLRQTPRFLTAVQDFDKTYEILEQMAQQNNPGHKIILTSEQKQEIVEFYKKSYEGKQRAEFKSLFDNYYLRTTICLSIAWFCISFIYFGQLVSLPFIFGKVQKSFSSYALTVLGEIPCFFLSIFLVDRPNFGRKNSLKYFFTLSSIMHILFALNPLTLFSSVCRFFMKMCFQMLYPCTTESYGTLNRSLGFGFNSAVGRIGSTIMPFIILPLINTSFALISVIFAVISLVGAIASYLLPRQPMNRCLDERTETELSEVDEDNDSQKKLQKLLIDKLQS